MLHNTPEMVEAHYAVPALNAVLNTLNTRLDAPLLAWQMNHCETAVLLTDRELAPTMAEALRRLREDHGRSPGPAYSLSHTSITTGDPKGVVTHHRGAYLNAVCNAATWTLPHFPRYLWTLPMFHCN